MSKDDINTLCGADVGQSWRFSFRSRVSEIALPNLKSCHKCVGILKQTEVNLCSWGWNQTVELYFIFNKPKMLDEGFLGQDKTIQWLIFKGLFLTLQTAVWQSNLNTKSTCLYVLFWPCSLRIWLSGSHTVFLQRIEELASKMCFSYFKREIPTWSSLEYIWSRLWIVYYFLKSWQNVLLQNDQISDTFMDKTLKFTKDREHVIDSLNGAVRILKVRKWQNMQAQTHTPTPTHTYTNIHQGTCNFPHNLSRHVELQAFSAYIVLGWVLVYYTWIYTMYVSTILKHIFFAIEPGLSAKPSGLHILEISGCHFSKQWLKSTLRFTSLIIMHECTNTHMDTHCCRQANALALHKTHKHTHTTLTSHFPNVSQNVHPDRHIVS